MNYVYLYFCYFTFGYCLSFPGVATQFIMIDVLHFSPVEMTMAMGIISSPWTMKPLFGFLSDKYEIFDWGRRRPYIACGGLCAAFMYVYIEHFMASKQLFTMALTFISVSVCVADVCADSITVEHVKNEDIKGKLQSNCWISRAFGTLIGAFFGGSSVQHIWGYCGFSISEYLPCDHVRYDLASTEALRQRVGQFVTCIVRQHHPTDVTCVYFLLYEYLTRLWHIVFILFEN